MCSFICFFLSFRFFIVQVFPSLLRFISRCFIFWSYCKCDFLSLTSFLVSLWLEYRRATGFCMLILCSATLLKMFIRSKNFLVKLLRSFKNKIMSSVVGIIWLSFVIFILFIFSYVLLLLLKFKMLCWVRMKKMGTLVSFSVTKKANEGKEQMRRKQNDTYAWNVTVKPASLYANRRLMWKSQRKKHVLLHLNL